MIDSTSFNLGFHWKIRSQSHSWQKERSQEFRSLKDTTMPHMRSRTLGTHSDFCAMYNPSGASENIFWGMLLMWIVRNYISVFFCFKTLSHFLGLDGYELMTVLPLKSESWGLASAIKSGSFQKFLVCPLFASTDLHGGTIQGNKLYNLMICHIK